MLLIVSVFNSMYLLRLVLAYPVYYIQYLSLNLLFGLLVYCSKVFTVYRFSNAVVYILSHLFRGNGFAYKHTIYKEQSKSQPQLESLDHFALHSYVVIFYVGTLPSIPLPFI